MCDDFFKLVTVMLAALKVNLEPDLSANGSAFTVRTLFILIRETK
jgi:hypothetical protein